MKWHNPSRADRVWDPQTNRTIEPGTSTDRRPAANLIRTGQLVEINDKPVLQPVIPGRQHVTVQAALELAPATPVVPMFDE